MNVSKITIGRLFNLGNYEHVRYELTVEIPAGESPATAIIGMENILNGLNPKRPDGVPQDYVIQNLKSQLAGLEMNSKDDLARDFECSRDNAHEIARKTIQDQLDANQAVINRWREIQRISRKLLDDLGGAAIFTDAKQLWVEGDGDAL